MKKSIAILVVLVVSLCAFAGNNTPLKKAPRNPKPATTVQLRIPGKNNQLIKPMAKPKKSTLAKQVKTK